MMPRIFTGRPARKRCAVSLLAGLAMVPALSLGTAWAMYDSGDAPPSARPAGAAAQRIELTPTLRFEPETVTIRAGQTVEWTNVSSFPHTVTADASRAGNPGNVALPGGVAAFDVRLGNGETFRKTLNVPGVYRYVCLPHESAGMVGKIVVEAADT